VKWKFKRPNNPYIFTNFLLLKYADYDSDDDIVIPTGTLRDIIRKQKKKMQSTSSNDD
jgi:hypothetical protein